MPQPTSINGRLRPRDRWRSFFFTTYSQWEWPLQPNAYEGEGVAQQISAEAGRAKPPIWTAFVTSAPRVRKDLPWSNCQVWPNLGQDEAPSDALIRKSCSWLSMDKIITLSLGSGYPPEASRGNGYLNIASCRLIWTGSLNKVRGASDSQPATARCT